MKREDLSRGVKFDVRNVSDDDAIKMTKLTSGNTRLMWISALKFTSGRSGIAFLKEMVGSRTPEKAAYISEALHTLSRRDAAVAAEAAVALLRHRSPDVQLQALLVLTEQNRTKDLDDIYSWIQKRLRRISRWEFGGNYELPMFLLFATESSSLTRMLAILDDPKTQLLDQEVARIERVWPGSSRQKFREGSSEEAPDLGAIRAWQGETMAQLSYNEDDEAAALSRDLGRSWNRLHLR